MFVVNKNPNYKPKPFKGDGYQEINGATALPFIKQIEWIKDAACGVLQNRVVDQKGQSVHDQTAQTMVYKGVVNGKTVGLLLGPLQSPYRLFAVQGEEKYKRLLDELQDNKGFLNEQMAAVGKVYSNNDADALYSWQNNFFGLTGQQISKIIKTSKVARTKSEEATKGTRAKLMKSQREVVELVTEIAKRYDVYNVEVNFGKFDGQTTGWAQVTEDSVTPFSLPVGVRVWFAEEIMYRHTVIHEMAHAIEMIRHGISGHGKGFRSIYKLLLRQYHGVSPEGL